MVRTTQIKEMAKMAKFCNKHLSKERRYGFCIEVEISVQNRNHFANGKFMPFVVTGITYFDKALRFITRAGTIGFANGEGLTDVDINRIYNACNVAYNEMYKQ